MATTGDWIEKKVPKERCNEEKAKLSAEGFEIKPESPVDSRDSRMCIITYRATYSF